MAFLTFNRIGITGVAASVPKQKIINKKFTGVFTPKEVKSVIQMTGIAERRVTDEKTCASDLCYAAAKTIIDEMSIKPNEIDVLIFVSQTPDYRTCNQPYSPESAWVMQNHCRLGYQPGLFRLCLWSGIGVFFRTAELYRQGPASERRNADESLFV